MCQLREPGYEHHICSRNYLEPSRQLVRLQPMYPVQPDRATLEVVVTNASSNPEIFDAVTRVCAKYPLAKMVEHRQDVFNFSRCQNVAIQATSGNYVMYTCIDKLFSKRFMEEVYRLIAPNLMVNIRQFPTPNWSWLRRCQYAYGALGFYHGAPLCLECYGHRHNHGCGAGLVI